MMNTRDIIINRHYYHFKLINILIDFKIEIRVEADLFTTLFHYPTLNSYHDDSEKRSNH